MITEAYKVVDLLFLGIAFSLHAVSSSVVSINCKSLRSFAVEYKLHGDVSWFWTACEELFVVSLIFDDANLMHNLPENGYNLALEYDFSKDQ